jgi:hypothetical protein
MTKQHKATPEQWAFVETCAPEDFAGFACILELRDRLEALEAGQQPPQDKLDRLIAIDRDDPTNSLVDRVADDAELCKVYNDAPKNGFGMSLRAVYDLGRQHGADPIRSGPESPLVERVGRVAIREVAAWLRWKSEWVASDMLEQEASQ